MTEEFYYREVFAYGVSDGFYANAVFFAQGPALMRDLEKAFSKSAAGSADFKALEELRKTRVTRMYGTDKKNGDCCLLLAKKIDQPQWVVVGPEATIVIDKEIQFLNMQLAMPARGSGYPDCSLNLGKVDGAEVTKPLAEFANGLFGYSHSDRFFHLAMEIKKFVDFLRVPSKFDTFMDA